MFTNGTIDISELKPQLSYDVRGGWTKTRTFVGIESSIRKLADTIRNNGATNSATIDPTNPPYTKIDIFQSSPDDYWTCVVSYAVDLQYAWTFNVNSLENDITLHPLFQGLVLYTHAQGGLDYATQQERAVRYHIINIAIDLALSKGMPWGSTSEIGLINIAPTVGGAYLLMPLEVLAIQHFQTEFIKLVNGDEAVIINTIQNLFRLKNRQINSYPISQPVLRKTTLLPMFTTDFPICSTCVNGIFTSAGLMSYFSSAKYGVLPTTIKTAMDALPIYNANSTRYWIYNGYSIDQQNTSKLLISQEFSYVQDADTFIYGTPFA